MARILWCRVRRSVARSCVLRPLHSLRLLALAALLALCLRRRGRLADALTLTGSRSRSDGVAIRRRMRESLPNGGVATFVCANVRHTTGSTLGTGSHENDPEPCDILDRTGRWANSSGASSETFTVAIAADALDAGAPGDNVISVSEINRTRVLDLTPGDAIQCRTEGAQQIAVATSIQSDDQHRCDHPEAGSPSRLTAAGTWRAGLLRAARAGVASVHRALRGALEPAQPERSGVQGDRSNDRCDPGQRRSAPRGAGRDA